MRILSGSEKKRTVIEFNFDYIILKHTFMITGCKMWIKEKWFFIFLNVITDSFACCCYLGQIRMCRNSSSIWSRQILEKCMKINFLFEFVSLKACSLGFLHVCFMEFWIQKKVLCSLINNFSFFSCVFFNKYFNNNCFAHSFFDSIWCVQFLFEWEEMIQCWKWEREDYFSFLCNLLTDTCWKCKGKGL